MSELKREYVIIEEDKLALLADETRRNILKILKDREASAKELAKILGKSVQTIHHHLRILKENNLIYVSKEIRKHHLIERVYKAKPIYVRVLLSMKARKQIRNIVLDVLDILEEKFDVKIKGDKREIADKVAYYMALLDGFLGKEKEIINNFRDIITTLNPLSERFAVSILALASLTNEEFEEYVTYLRELRGVLRKCLEIQ